MLPKRLTWFGLGAVSGALGAMWAYVRVREVSTVDADRVARSVVGAARAAGGHLAVVVEESRRGAAEAEVELREGLEARRTRRTAHHAPNPRTGLAPNPRRGGGRRSVG